MNTLVTGCMGFIGSHLVNHLVKKGHFVIGLDNFKHTCGNIVLCECIKGDIRGCCALINLIELHEIQTVIHLAALINVDESMQIPEEYLKNNVLGTQNVIDICLEKGVKMIYASSSEVYGNPDTIPINESAPTRCESVYAVSKLAGEKLVGVAHHTQGLDAVRLRVYNTMGQFQRSGQYGAVIPIFVEEALAGRPLPIFGDGRQQRDYIHVSDVCRAYEMALTWNVTDSVNIGTGSAYSINEIAGIVNDITGSKAGVIHKDPRPGEVRHLEADVFMAEGLGFQAKMVLWDGIKDYVEWRKEMGV